MKDPVVQFEEAMSDDEYGIIIGRDGELKGLFVPTLIDDGEEVPESIVAIITEVFGLDIDGNNKIKTMH